MIEVKKALSHCFLLQDSDEEETQHPLWASFKQTSDNGIWLVLRDEPFEEAPERAALYLYRQGDLVELRVWEEKQCVNDEDPTAQHELIAHISQEES